MMDRIGQVLEKRPLPMGTSAVLALQYFGSSIFWRDRVGRVLEKSPIFYQKEPTKKSLRSIEKSPIFRRKESCPW